MNYQDTYGAVTRRDIDPAEYQDNPENYNRHDEDQLAIIERSLRVFGQIKDVVVWRGLYVAGHGLSTAARRMGLPTLRATVIPDEWPREAVNAYLVADNETAKKSTPDEAQLQALVREAADFDKDFLQAMGFDDAELQALLEAWEAGGASSGSAAPAGPVNRDTAPSIERAEELQKVWGTEAGQLWRLGPHRVICGDSTDPAVVARLFGPDSADMVHTDPPYGVDYAGGLNQRKRAKLKGDDTLDLYGRFLPAAAGRLKASAPLYVWFADKAARPVYEGIEAAGYTVRAMIVWHKLNAHYGNFMAQYMQKHEPCLYCVKGAPVWNGPTNEVTVWEVVQPGRNEYHPTEKPLDLPLRAITNSSDPGAIVYDPFCGSGTTLLAADNLGRVCYGVEIEPKFVAVILDRYQNHTGRSPELEIAPLD